MSTAISISTHRRHGVARVCRVWGVARLGLYRSRRVAGAHEQLFHGEGYRKVWARLRHQGLRTSKERGAA